MVGGISAGTTTDLKKNPLVFSGCVSSLAELILEAGEQEDEAR